MQFNLPTGKHVEVSIHKSLARFRHNLALMGGFLNFPCIKPYFGFKKIKPREVIFRFSLSTFSSVKSHQHYFPCDFFPSLAPTAFEICSRKGGPSEYFVSVRIGAKYGKIHLFPLLGRCTLCYCHEWREDFMGPLVSIWLLSPISRSIRNFIFISCLVWDSIIFLLKSRAECF